MLTRGNNGGKCEAVVIVCDGESLWDGSVIDWQSLYSVFAQSQLGLAPAEALWKIDGFFDVTSCFD